MLDVATSHFASTRCLFFMSLLRQPAWNRECQAQTISRYSSQEHPGNYGKLMAGHQNDFWAPISSILIARFIGI